MPVSICCLFNFFLTVFGVFFPLLTSHVFLPLLRASVEMEGKYGVFTRNWAEAQDC